MAYLENKRILILSPQAWGTMFLSKHHYAVELAKKGNTVYFLNPPDEGHQQNKSVHIEEIKGYDTLYLVTHRLFFPYNIKFRFISLFHFLMKWQVKKILKAIGMPVDIIWSFDLGNIYPFSLFPKETKKIFHPVDEPVTAAAIKSAMGSEIIFSVTKEILAKYDEYPAPKHFINHGVSEYFLNAANGQQTHHEPVRVGFSGNLLRPDIDKPVFLQIINENPSVIFECWGSYQTKQSNIGGGSDKEADQFISELRQLPNVVLHGPVPSEKLAEEFTRMDMFLICYDVERDQSKGTNYHKVMEYLSTGKVIVSNNITTYKDQPELVMMVDERTDNRKLPALFKKVITDISHYNSLAMQKRRRDFAVGNTYTRQVERIDELLVK